VLSNSNEARVVMLSLSKHVRWLRTLFDRLRVTAHKNWEEKLFLLILLDKPYALPIIIGATPLELTAHGARPNKIFLKNSFVIKRAGNARRAFSV